MPQNLTTPDRLLNNPLSKKGFCEAHQYKHALERCNHGHESLELNIELQRGLIDVFKNFSEALTKWSEQSKKRISSSNESTTTKQAWRETIVAVKKYTDRNNAVADAIEKNVVKELDAFKNKYGKCLIGVQKSKDLEKSFKRHHNPWWETVDKIKESKSAYSDARGKLEEVKYRQETTKRDVSSTEEEIRKASQEVDRRLRKLESCKRKYHSAIDGITTKQNEYEKDMLAVLKDADAFEKERLEKVHACFTSLKEALLVETEQYDQALGAELDKAIHLQKIDDDLAHFDKTYGRQTETKWPNFEQIKD